jgi:hypothetical protein
MIETPGSVELASTRSENKHSGMPLTPSRFIEQALHIVRADGSLEAVQKNENGSSGRSIQVMQDHGVPVGCLHALDSCIVDALAAKKFPP